MWRSTIAALVFLSAAAIGNAAEVRLIETAGPVRQIVQTPRGAFVETDGGTYRLRRCGPSGICLSPTVIRGLPRRAPLGALPDGEIATARAGDIRRAWYGDPTRRYGHGVLGDAIEAGVLVAELAGNREVQLELPQSHVFEDLTPRIADLDGDGRNEIIAIRSSLTAGAAVAIYGVRTDRLVLLAQTPDIGRSNRWLNIAGIADYTGGGQPVIAWVETPHIGGKLKMAVFDGEALRPIADTRDGFSNHVIGSRELLLSLTLDVSGDGVPELLLPSADRARLRIVSRKGVSSIDVGARITHRIIAVDGTIVTATGDGKLLAIDL